MRPLNFLIVDDDDMIRDRLATFFDKYGVTTSQAASASEARGLLKDNQYDLVTLDVIMPGEGGLDLIKWIKSEYDVPVILLTSLDEAVDTVAGLEVGADDYVSKPFDPRVLLARAKAVIRRYEGKESPSLRKQSVGELHFGERVLKLDGKDYALNSTEFELLKILVEANGEPVSREDFYTRMLGRDWHPEDRAIDNLVARLRQRLEKTPQTPKCIVTVRHKGYFIPEGMVSIRN